METTGTMEPLAFDLGGVSAFGRRLVPLLLFDLDTDGDCFLLDILVVTDTVWGLFMTIIIADDLVTLTPTSDGGEEIVYLAPLAIESVSSTLFKLKSMVPSGVCTSGLVDKVKKLPVEW